MTLAEPVDEPAVAVEADPVPNPVYNTSPPPEAVAVPVAVPVAPAAVEVIL